jgi:DNA polymerase elongation subunit (family B)
MSYVDAYLNKEEDRIYVVERIDGKRIFTEYPAEYRFYYDDPRGKFQTIYGTPVSRFTTRNSKEFHKELRINSNNRIWEGDINPVLRCLSENYLNAAAPQLQTAFFDIEVAFDQDRGFSSPTDPFNPITAISVYLDWLDQLITLVIPPNHISDESAAEIANKFENCLVFRSEADLLNTFLEIIDDADILSGWNSEGYDIPYTVNRTVRVLSKNDIRRFCLWDQNPRKRTFERFGNEETTFDLIGRVHLDYMQLYRNYTYHEMHSYSLDAISEYELGEKKVAYEGTLDQLYNKDFQKFIDYNRQDTMLLAKLDKKLRFIDLSNELAHENTVLLAKTMSAVALTEQAIINEAHAQGLIIPNRKEYATDDNRPAAGAYVAYPKKGMHEWIGAIDINSLYPSAIRALNMAPETIVGQLRPIMTDNYIQEKIDGGAHFAAAWEGLFGSLEYSAVMNQERGTEITVDWESGDSTTHSAAELWRLIFDSHNKWTLSANGTIFSYERDGIVPGLLARWYAERKELQAKKKDATDKAEIAFWDKRQLVKKINLNSLYGAILNPGCRFFDARIGQSTTLTGRQVVKHMNAKINELVAGEYNHVGVSNIYADTDSAYFSIWPVIKESVERGDMVWNKDACVELYDAIAEQVNESFPAFMEQNFHCPRRLGELIRGGRELIASKGLYITKKRYAVLIYDLEGKRLDVNGEQGKTKAMGLDLKRSDTPKIVQDFLSKVLMEVLTGADREQVIDMIKEFKAKFSDLPAWQMGTPKRVNNLTKFTREEERLGKANMPGHVRAAMNWNNLRRMHGDNHSMKITDGMKTIVCKLKNNPLGLTSVGYPIDQLNLPEWYKELPFDNAEMEDTIVDQKIDNLLGILDWNLRDATTTKTKINDLFSFE